MRATTIDARTRARADTVLLNPPHSTPPQKPQAPPMTVRIPPNHRSSRAGATESFQIQPRVGCSEIPSPARSSQGNLVHTAASVISACLFSVLSCSPTSCHYSSLSAFVPLKPFRYIFLCTHLDTSQSSSFTLFAFPWSVVLVAMMSPSLEA